MAETPSAKRHKSRKLIPIVTTRRRRPIKKEASLRTPSEPNSAAFEDLVEAAHRDASWQRGSARPRQESSRVQSTVTFGGATGVGSHHAEGRQVVWSGSGIKTEPGLKKEERDEMMEDAFPDDPFRPTTIPIRSLDPTEARDDTEKLLPRYIEQRLADMDSEPSDNAAQELGITDSAGNPGAILFQLPSDLPLTASKSDEGESDRPQLPEGKIGKLSVHQSGRVTLQMGDVTFDVSSGTSWPFHQQLVAINVRDEDGHCVFLGDVRKRALCTINVSQLLESEIHEACPSQQPLPQGQTETDDADQTKPNDTTEPAKSGVTDITMGRDAHKADLEMAEEAQQGIESDEANKKDITDS